MAATEELTPTVIRRKRFEMVRRGFDPQEVGAFLEQIASRLAAAERAVGEAEERLTAATVDLEDAKAAEEALQMTMVVATQAKDEMLARAKSEAEEIRIGAQREAEAVVTDARRQALTLIEDSRREADDVVSAARKEHESLITDVDRLRSAVAGVRDLLGSVGNDPTLARAEYVLDHPEDVSFATTDADNEPPVGSDGLADAAGDETAEPEDVAVDLSAAGERGDEAAEVERLLKQLRGG